MQQLIILDGRAPQLVRRLQMPVFTLVFAGSATRCPM
jgi:hypothetical protein